MCKLPMNHHDRVIGPLLFLLFENDLPDVHEALMLLFAGDVKMVTRRTQNRKLHSSLTVEEMEPTDQSCKVQLPKISQGSRGSDR